MVLGMQDDIESPMSWKVALKEKILLQKLLSLLPKIIVCKLMIQTLVKDGCLQRKEFAPLVNLFGKFPITLTKSNSTNSTSLAIYIKNTKDFGNCLYLCSNIDHVILVISC